MAGMSPTPTRLIPEWVDDPDLKGEFLDALSSCGGARGNLLAEILTANKDLRVWTWTLGLDDIYLIIITSKKTDLLRDLGETHNFPRGYPIIWKPGCKLNLFGFYPKFKNDEMYKASPTDGVKRLLLSIKWSGFLFSILPFCHQGRYYWVVTSKNSGNCRDSDLDDFTQIASDVIEAEMGKLLPNAIKELADNRLYLCGECMSVCDQGHGYGYLKDAIRVTCAGHYDNQYVPETPNCDALLMHLPADAISEICEKLGFPCVRNVEVPASKVNTFMAEMERSRDFLTASSLTQLLSRHELPVEQMNEHLDIVNSDTLEGLVMQFQYHSKPPLRIKWKLPRYTLVTMLLRPVRKDAITGRNLVDMCTSTAKRWCRTPAACEYYTMVGMLAGTLVKELPSGQVVAPWITAANQIFAMEHAEVLRCGQALIADVQKSEQAALVTARHVLGVQKHDSMGCAVVTLATSNDRQQLLAYGSKIDLNPNVQADVKQHFDKGTKELCPDRVFLAWGRRQELNFPISIETIITVLESHFSIRETADTPKVVLC